MLLRRITIFIAGAAATFFITEGAFVLGMALAFSLPVTGADLEFALHKGIFWGVVGGLVVGLLACRVQPNWRASLRVIGFGSLLWAWVAGTCFSFYVAVIGSG